MNIKPQCPYCKSCDVYQHLDQLFMCKTCNETFECEHKFIIDALKMLQSKEHGTICKPVRICLVCNEIVLELPT